MRAGREQSRVCPKPPPHVWKANRIQVNAGYCIMPILLLQLVLGIEVVKDLLVEDVVARQLSSIEFRSDVRYRASFSRQDDKL